MAKSLAKRAELIPVDRRPAHVAIIMDGNGRWAQARGLPRFEGHRRGAKAVRRAMAACQELGVQHLTLYCFSSENWKRPQQELDFLMNLLRTYIRRERNNFEKNGVRLTVIGKRDGLPEDIVDELEKTIDASRHGEFNLCLAINYGSRAEIIDAIKSVSRDVVAGDLTEEEITAELISDRLDTRGMPDPDLLIRTSGEFRISNFLLWQISYTELWITAKHWPEFSEDDLADAIEAYTKRDRRFGGIKSHVSEDSICSDCD